MGARTMATFHEGTSFGWVGRAPHRAPPSIFRHGSMAGCAKRVNHFLEILTRFDEYLLVNCVQPKSAPSYEGALESQALLS